MTRILFAGLLGILLAAGCGKKDGVAEGDTNAAPASAEAVTGAVADTSAAVAPEVAAQETPAAEAPAATEAAADAISAETAAVAAEGTGDTNLAATTETPAPEVKPELTPADYEAMQAKVTELEAANKKLEAELATSREEAKQLVGELASLSNRYDGLSRSMDQLVADKRKVEAEAARLANLDKVEFAQVVELALQSPEGGLKVLRVFMEKFPNSPLIPAAQKREKELVAEMERREREQAQINAFHARNKIFIERAPLRTEKTDTATTSTPAQPN